MAKEIKGKSGTTYIIEGGGRGAAIDRHERINRRSQERMERFNRHYPYHWDLEMIGTHRIPYNDWCAKAPVDDIRCKPDGKTRVD
jgi:hypothetical protein